MMSVTIEMVPNYKRATDLWPDAPTLSEYYKAIESALDGNNHGLVEHVKAFIECFCVTLLSEFNSPLPSSTPSTTELLVEALKSLGLHNSKGASKLDKVLSGFNKLSDALSEMRNESGPVAHGKDGFLDSLNADHGRAFLCTGDAIVGVLLNAMEGAEPDLLVTREPYERFSHLGKKIDRSVSIKADVEIDDTGHMLLLSVTTAGKNDEAIKLRIEPSRLLYGLDRSAFLEVLNESPKEIPELEEAETETEALEAANLVVEETTESAIQETAVQIEQEATGDLLKYKEELEKFLKVENLLQEGSEGVLNDLLNVAEQNMVVDWQVRESQQVKLKQLFRRVFQRYGLSRFEAVEGATRVLSWFLVQIPLK